MAADLGLGTSWYVPSASISSRRVPSWCLHNVCVPTLRGQGLGPHFVWKCVPPQQKTYETALFQISLPRVRMTVWFTRVWSSLGHHHWLSGRVYLFKRSFWMGSVAPWRNHYHHCKCKVNYYYNQNSKLSFNRKYTCNFYRNCYSIPTTKNLGKTENNAYAQHL